MILRIKKALCWSVSSATISAITKRIVSLTSNYTYHMISFYIGEFFMNIYKKILMKCEIYPCYQITFIFNHDAVKNLKS